MVMIPKLPKIPSKMGEDAQSGGLADQNESVSARERSGESLSEMGSGPKIAPNGAYLPAKYEQITTFQTPAGPVSIKQIVEDR